MQVRNGAKAEVKAELNAKAVEDLAKADEIIVTDVTDERFTRELRSGQF